MRSTTCPEGVRGSARCGVRAVSDRLLPPGAQPEQRGEPGRRDVRPMTDGLAPAARFLMALNFGVPTGYQQPQCMVGLTVRNLTRHAIDSGRCYYTADVTNGGDVTALSSRWGSWMTPDARREAKPLVAAMLQREVSNKERVVQRA
jgi:hypothetical protein